MLWICCGLYSKSTSPQQIEFQWSLDFDKLWTCRGVAANHSELLYHVTTYAIIRHYNSQNEVVDENAKILQFSTASLIDAYHNEPTL